MYKNLLFFAFVCSSVSSFKSHLLISNLPHRGRLLSFYASLSFFFSSFSFLFCIPQLALFVAGEFRLHLANDYLGQTNYARASTVTQKAQMKKRNAKLTCAVLRLRPLLLFCSARYLNTNGLLWELWMALAVRLATLHQHALCVHNC